MLIKTGADGNVAVAAVLPILGCVRTPAGRHPTGDGANHAGAACQNDVQADGKLTRELYKITVRGGRHEKQEQTQNASKENDQEEDEYAQCHEEERQQRK